MKENHFIGRKDELKRLEALNRKSAASLVVIRGRRRIGKSRLVEEFAKNKRFFSFAGIPPTDHITAQSQRDVFAEQFCKQIGLQSITSQDWATLFSLLAKETAKGEVVILLDEISWMGSKDPTFLGKLKNVWDLEFRKNNKLVLILCGSVSTWIENNIVSNTAFFGRIALNMKLEELPLHDCNTFLLSRGFKGSSYEIFKILSITGGIPWYLEQIQAGIGADDNIRDMCFREDGVLFNEFTAIFHDLFEKRSSIYQPIVEVLAKKPMEFNAICSALGYAKSGTLSDYLDDLIQSGFISRFYTWWIKSGKASQLSQYRLCDNYLRFYLKYILPNQEQIARGAYKNLNLATLPNWSSVMGLQFENLVLKNRNVILDHLQLRREDIIADNPYFQTASVKRSSCQIDYLIQTRYNTLFACEIKFSINPLKTDVIADVEQKIAKMVLPKRFSCWPVVIHVNGISDALIDKNYFAHCVDFSDLLENP